MTEPLILASQSAARAALLRNAGVPIETQPARVDEASIKAAMLAEDAPPRDIADILAERKAVRVSQRAMGRLVLGADQVLVCNGRLYDKAPDRTTAAEQLGNLAGQRHALISAAVIALDGEPIWRHIGIAHLQMRPLSAATIDWYLEAAGEDVLGSVGCYHLEGLGAQLFARVDGDYFTVLGLPLLEVLGFLRARGILVE